MKTKVVDRGIYRADNGMWWEMSFVKEGYASSLHTRDEAKARAKHAERYASLKKAYDEGETE